jgi:hypothetical protein
MPLQVVNSEWLRFLFGCVQHHQGVAACLRGAAADVITEIVSKRTDAVPKLQLLQQLDVVRTQRAAHLRETCALECPPSTGGT